MRLVGGRRAVTVFLFVFFTGLVAVITYFATRGDDHATVKGYFLAGRSLTWPFIAGSLLLTNLSTEQLVGLNGSAYADGLSVMAWEVVAVLALVAMAWFFLPRFLRSGVTTVPEYLLLRFDHGTRVICSLIFLSAYAVILLPIILYTGATGLIGILDIQGMLGIESREVALWIVVWAVGVIGSVYALFGGLRTVAVSDTLNGVGLLVGGLLITWFGLSALGHGSVIGGIHEVAVGNPHRLNSNGSAASSVPFGTLFSGVLLLNLFYWTTNQQIIQRTFGAVSLAEGQKGVVATGLLKLLGPLYLVLPGLIAYAMFPDLGDAKADQAYGMLVNDVLPLGLTGFFAAAMMGAILSSYNSALNSTCTLFSLGIYQGLLDKRSDDAAAVKSGKIFGWALSIVAMTVAPLLIRQQSIFSYLQQMNGIYFIPIFAVVLCGMLSTRIPALAAKIVLVAGPIAVACAYFVPPVARLLAPLHEYHFLGLIFVALVGFMVLMGRFMPRSEPWLQAETHAVDMTPWPHAKTAGLALVAAVAAIYVWFADFG
jgi:SSS family solute:Na+ symporter